MLWICASDTMNTVGAVSWPEPAVAWLTAVWICAWAAGERLETGVGAEVGWLPAIVTNELPVKVVITPVAKLKNVTRAEAGSSPGEGSENTIACWVAGL